MRLFRTKACLGACRRSTDLGSSNRHQEDKRGSNHCFPASSNKASCKLGGGFQLRRMRSNNKTLFVSIIIFLCIFSSYICLQIFVSYRPPIRSTGYGILAAMSGENVISSIFLSNKYHFLNYAISDVTVRSASFEASRFCVISRDGGEIFIGSIGSVLEEKFASRCVPINNVRSDWQEYSLVIFGDVLTNPTEGERIDVVVLFKVLGWPHKIIFQPRLLKPKE